MAAQGTFRQWSPVRVAQILFALTLIGLFGGLLMIYSVSYPFALTRTGNAFSIVSRQALYAALGFVLFLTAWKIPLQRLRRVSWVLHLFIVALLITTLIVGKKVGNAQRWLEFGPFQVQPSEFSKVTLVLYIAALAASWRDTVNLSRKFGLWLVLLLCWTLTVALVLKQPHLSGALLLAVIGVAAMFFARMPLSLILAMILLSGGLGYLGRKLFLQPYQQQRWQIGSWLILPKEKTDEQKSYQVRQALLGLQVGGWFGQGFFQSRQKHLFLPAAHNDFIFAVIGEEFGFIGSVAVLTFFTLLAYFGLWVTSQTADAFASGVSGGITVWIWLQAILHIAVNTHLLPPTGVPLPFVSVGGSALCAILIGMGLLLNVASNLTQQRKQKRRGGTSNALGDGRWRDGRAHLSSPRPRRRRQNYVS